jgi:type III restriction enzyme
MIRETKSDLDPNKRRNEENVKIKCGEAHFDILPDVEFKVVNDARQV